MLGDDTVNVQMATPTILDVMNNDNDPDSPYTPQTLTITGLTSPSNGTAVIVGTGVQYTSSASYLGPDSFSYMLIDQDANLSSTATVNITVSSSNTPPLAYSGNLTTNEDAPFVGTLSGYDADGTPLTFLMNTNGSNGTVSIGSTGGYVYTPNLNYS